MIAYSVSLALLWSQSIRNMYGRCLRGQVQDNLFATTQYKPSPLISLSILKSAF